MVMQRPDISAGFGLLETVVSAGLLVMVVAGVAQLTAMSIAATRASGQDATALRLAAQKIEQLKSLRWSFDRSRTGRVSDVATDLTRDPPSPGGAGLSASPRRSLERSMFGYVDYLDAGGRWLGTGGVPPAGTSFVRRWSVRTVRRASADLLVLDVVVMPAPLARLSGWTQGRVPPPGIVWLTTMKGRD